MTSSRLAIVGATGFVGHALSTRLAEGADIYAVDRGDLPALSAMQPRAILNAAALSDITSCESDPAEAQRANVDLPARLAEIAGDDTRIIHLSTDQVFDGAVGGYAESDPPRPISGYGRTKLAGEEAVLSTAGNAVVLRINLVCGRSTGPRPSTVDRMLAAAGKGQDIPLFTDEYRSPVALSDVVDAVVILINHDFSGLLHWGGPRLSRYELGHAILTKHGLAERALATTLTSYSGPPRTPDTSFDTALAVQVLERTPRDLSGILDDC